MRNTESNVYNTPIEICFEQPIELKKGKSYVFKTIGSLPMDVVQHIIKSIKKTTGANVVIIDGSVNIEEI